MGVFLGVFLGGFLSSLCWWICWWDLWPFRWGLKNNVFFVLQCFVALLCAGPSVFTRKNRSKMHAGGLRGSAAEGSVKSMRMSHHVLAAFAFAVSVDLCLARRSVRQRLNQTEQSTRPCPSLSVLGPIGADWKQQKSRPPAAGQPAVPATPWQ